MNPASSSPCGTPNTRKEQSGRRCGGELLWNVSLLPVSRPTPSAVDATRERLALAGVDSGDELAAAQRSSGDELATAQRSSGGELAAAQRSSGGELAAAPRSAA